MKYLTKEWLNTELLSYTYSQIKISKRQRNTTKGIIKNFIKKSASCISPPSVARNCIRIARRIKKNRGIDR